jgi:hypothetical protein
MVMGHHHTELEEGEGPKTALSTKQGWWKYRRLPFWAKNSARHVSRTNELGTEWVDRVTLFCWPGLYCNICQVTG